MDHQDAPDPAIWQCKIGETTRTNLPPGSDVPMRRAVQRAYTEITGDEAEFTFSGWGAQLTPMERSVVDNTPPPIPPEDEISRLRRVVYELWHIIDDIDTYDDAAKSDDAGYRRAVHKRQAQRWEHLGEGEVDALYKDFYPGDRPASAECSACGAPLERLPGSPDLYCSARCNSGTAQQEG